jgi:mono/diheme cytochrome c family protein
MKSVFAAASIALLAAALSACSPLGGGKAKVAMAPPPSTASAMRAANGLKLARQWCASCHSVEADGTASDKAPPFSAIAARRDTNWIKAWLADPHPPMKGITLSNEEIADLTAYIKSLAPTAR